MFCNSLTTANKIKTSVLLFVPAKQVVDRKEYSSHVLKQNQKRDLLLSISYACGNSLSVLSYELQ